MSKNMSKIVVWLIVDVLLFAAIVTLIAFVVGQTKSNNGGNALKTPTPAASSTPKPTSTPTPEATSTPTPTEEPTATPTEAATPTPEATATPVPTEAPAVVTNAYVDANVLNIRTGAGTTYDKVTLNGENVQLTRDHRVQILEVKENWFHVRFEFKGSVVEGYAYGPYIKPDANSGFDAIVVNTTNSGSNSGNTLSVNYTPVLDASKYASLDTTWREWWYSYANGAHTNPVPTNLNKAMAGKYAQLGFYYDNLNVSASDKVIYLTFDCGYENGCTAKILDTLKAKGVKACFFVTKGFLEQAPELAKRMKDEGHLVGNHTADHPSLAGSQNGAAMSVANIEKQMKTVEILFKQVTGYELDPYMRPPMGDYNERSLKVCQDLGYKSVVWSIAIYKDYDLNYQDKVDALGPFVSNHHNGAIALIHAVSTANTAALGDIIDYLSGQGYRFGTLNEL